jgi:DinB superfamily
MDDSGRPLDEPLQSPMLDGTDFVARLQAAERRLDRLARGPAPTGLSEPDPGATERWDAGQIWAHLVEFVPYWQEQVEGIIAAFDGEPVPFGRTKSDAARIEAVELGRSQPIADQRRAVHNAIERITRYLRGLTPAEWNAVGLHPRRGEMDVEAIVEEFVINHLEEHADQLERLGR